MPNRIIKESICTSDTIDQLTWFEEVFFYRLTVNCDDYGRFDARLPILKARLFPLKSVTEKQISDALHKLSTVGIVALYEYDGRPYLQLVTWEKHQTVRNKKGKYPAVDGREETTASENVRLISVESNCNQLNANASLIQSNPIQSESNPNPNPNPSNICADKPHRFTPPTLEEVAAYCKERNNGVDPQKWYDFYSAKGWMIGKNKMKDWKAAVRTWEKSDDFGNGRSKSSNPFIELAKEEGLL